MWSVERASPCQRGAEPSLAVPAKSKGGTLGADGCSGPPRIVQIEGDLLEPPLTAHEDIDLPVHRRAVESRRVRPIGAQAHREARPRGSRGDPRRRRRGPRVPGQGWCRRRSAPAGDGGQRTCLGSNLFIPRRFWRPHCPSRARSSHDISPPPKERYQSVIFAEESCTSGSIGQVQPPDFKRRRLAEGYLSVISGVASRVHRPRLRARISAMSHERCARAEPTPCCGSLPLRDRSPAQSRVGRQLLSLEARWQQ